MKSLFTIITMIIITMLTAHARIGETLAQCKARYGNPLDVQTDEKNKFAFSTGKIVIVARFHNGKCNYLFYQKVKTDAAGRSEEFNDNEIDLIFKANEKAGEWVAQEEGDLTGKLWFNENAKLLGHYNIRDRIVSICTTEGMKRALEQQDKEDKASIEGL